MGVCYNVVDNGNEYQKLLRDSVDNSMVWVDRKQLLTPETWYEQLFENFRDWMIESEIRGRRQNCFKRNQMWIFAAFFFIMFVVIYIVMCGMPFQDCSVEDLMMFIPQRHRGYFDPSADDAP